MAIKFRPLPISEFDPVLRPHIAKLNRQLRDLSDLEGVLANPTVKRRSDKTIARRSSPQVDATRITPAIVSGSSGGASTALSYVTVANEASLSAERALAVQAPITKSDGGANGALTLGVSTGVPAFAFATSALAGSANSLVRTDAQIALFDTTAPAALATAAATGAAAFPPRRDHVHPFPPTLQSLANLATLTLTDNAVNTTLTNSLGAILLTSVGAFTLTTAANANQTYQTVGTGQMILDTDTVTGPAAVVNVRVRPGAGVNDGIISGAIAGTITSRTVSMWNAKAAFGASTLTTAVLTGFRAQTPSCSPVAGSDTNNKFYSASLEGPNIGNANGGWLEIASLYAAAPFKTLADPTVTLSAGIITESATISATTQAGLYIRQRAAQQVATNRYGILIDAHNSGTNRRSIGADLADQADFSVITDGYSPGSFQVNTERYAIVSRHLKLTGTQRATLAGTATLRMS